MTSRRTTATSTAAAASRWRRAATCLGWLGSKISIGGYRIAQKLFKFN